MGAKGVQQGLKWNPPRFHPPTSGLKIRQEYFLALGRGVVFKGYYWV